MYIEGVKTIADWNAHPPHIQVPLGYVSDNIPKMVDTGWIHGRKRDQEIPGGTTYISVLIW
jgi:hypothetical protein